MCENNQLCHGIHRNILAASEACSIGFLDRRILRFKTLVRNTLWHLRTEGLLRTFKLAISKIVILPGSLRCNQIIQSDTQIFADQEILNLRPGDVVEVKSEAEILATLDENKKCKGLLWMPAMRKFCGRQFRVLKRLETILLEATGEVRKIKNTVLLEDVTCDGSDFYGCDRSCFHYWREAWLRRVESDKAAGTINSKK